MPPHTLHARVREVRNLSEVVPLDLHHKSGDGRVETIGSVEIPRLTFEFLAGEEPIPRRVYNLTLVPSANPDPE